jgi:uncharacterized protein (TIGR02594 family)
MTKYNDAILAAAGEYLGLAEWPGAKHNPEIIKMFAKVGHKGVTSDETPWCAAFVGAVLASLGLPHTGKLNARSYQTYGSTVRMQDARPGDIVVLWRSSRSSWEGHVAFFVRFEGNKVILRGGNQGNAVTDQGYDIDRILAIRRADGVVASADRPILRLRDRGSFVIDLQTKLVQLGYSIGRIDGDFGGETLGAVVKFQAYREIEADGIVGRETWRELDEASPKPKRDVTIEDLEKSRTVQAADKGIQTTTVTTASATLAGAVATAQEVHSTVSQAGSLVEAVISAGPWLIMTGVVLVGGYFLWKYLSDIKRYRLDDAQSGANLRR